MISTGELSERLATLYAAPLEPEKWQVFFDTFPERNFSSYSCKLLHMASIGTGGSRNYADNVRYDFGHRTAIGLTAAYVVKPSHYPALSASALATPAIATTFKDPDNPAWPVQRGGIRMTAPNSWRFACLRLQCRLPRPTD